MLRNFTFLIVSFLFSAVFSYAQVGLGTIKGSVIDGDTKEPIYGCKVLIKQNGSVKGGANTDFDGKFQINSVAPGSFDVEIRNETEGYQGTSIEGVIVSAEKITFLDNTELTKAQSVQDIGEVKVVAYRVPLIDKDGGASGATVTREDIARLPVRSATEVAGTVGGVNNQEDGGGVSVRGSRSDGTFYYIDGIKVRGSTNLPKSAIEEVSVITGGLPANYGDATGGIISITTRGPSATYFGSVEAVSSGFYLNGQDPNGYDGKVIGLDKFGYNLVEGMFSGPLWMEKDSTGKPTKPRLGFLASVNFTNQLDPRPVANGNWRVKKDVRDQLIQNPIRPTETGQGTYHNSLFLRQDDFEKTPYRMNAAQTVLSGQAKIDVNTGPSVNLTFGGSGNYNTRSLHSYNGSLLNFTNFGKRVDFDWRVFGRLTQRFTNDREGSASKIKSAFYTINVDYSKENVSQFDPKHGYNIFNYGHVGVFTTERENSYSYDPASNRYIHDGFRDVEVSYTPSSTNEALASITRQYYEIFDGQPVGNYENLFQIQQGNALRNGDSPQSVYNIWSNIGSPFNGFFRGETDQFRFTGSGSANIGDHSLSLGFEAEQRVDRGWGSGDAGPVGIWQTARQLMNFHITELDQSRATIDNQGSFKRVTYERLNTGYAFTSGTGEYGGQGGRVDSENNPILDNQPFFDYSVRQELGLDVAGTDFVDIDQYDPNLFRFGMFSPDELLNSGSNYVSYYGYDHTGQKVRGRTDVDKYFSEFDENGNYRRFIGAFQPIYGAVYLMDKFSFNDLVFNVGLRVDYFNANQPVLKDPYLLYEARTVAEVRQLKIDEPGKYEWIPEDLPAGMGDDFTVYVNDVNNPNQINGFRSGDIFYDANGTQVQESAEIRGAAGIAPFLIDPDATSPSGSAFEAYKPQINVMPRIAFSFPVSDEASFFAHYDILTQRPTTGARFDPIQYQFLAQRTNTINNPNLRPEKTIDYEIGFQQVVSKTSSLKFSAFYREFRDQVQLQTIFDAYPATYNTYSNRDFGTVKGLTVAYDLRRTGNIRSTINYTLQFAEGTGSNSTSAIGLINAGVPNLRFLAPFDYDQRHAINVTVDYRYGEGKDYNGPVIGDKKILENTGINVVSNINSGTPYSRSTIITNAATFSPQASGTDGSLNGSRLPWAYRLDLQVDRTFDWVMKKAEGEENGKTTYVNVYVRVTNLLNQFNRLGVYRATGNWDDDGYLAAAESQTAIQNQLDEQSFRDYYMMKVQNGLRISIPRTIRLGVKLDF